MWARLRDPGSYQARQYFITEADWNADEVWRRLRAAIPAREGILVLDGPGFPKQGRASVGVSRQYSGTLGKIGNCQVAVTAALWTGVQAWVVGAKRYLPATWLTPAQRARGRIPAAVAFQEKWRLALTLLRQVRASGITVTAVVADAEFGDCTAVRRLLHTIEVPYALGVSSHLTVFVGTPHTQPPATRIDRGRPASQPRLAPGVTPISIRDLAAQTAARHWRTVSWRNGTHAPWRARFWACRVTPAHDWRTRRVAQGGGAPGASPLGDRATVRRAERRTGARPFRRPVVSQLASTRRADRNRLRLHPTRTPAATPPRPDLSPGPRDDHRYSDGALFPDASTASEDVAETGGNTATNLTKSY